MPPERSLDETIVRNIASAFETLFNFAGSWIVPPGFETILKFTSANMKHLLEKSNDPAWKKTTLRDMHQMERVEKSMIALMWLTLNMGRLINKYRQTVGRHPVNWVEQATEYDKRRQSATVSDNGQGQVQPPD